MGIFRGVRTADGCIVTYDGKPLPLRLGIRNHSPTGFEWGYCGSGPAQLALSIIYYTTGQRELTERCYQDFKFAVVAALPRANGDDLGPPWELDIQEVREWVALWQRSHPEAPEGGMEA